MFKDRLASGLAAKSCMVEGYLHLLVSFANQRVEPGVAFVDLIAEGACGLFWADKEFDPQRDGEFSAYMELRIRAAVERSVESQRQRLPPGSDAAAAPGDARGGEEGPDDGAMLRALSPEERDVLRLRRGFVDGREWTLEEIGVKYGLSAESVGRIVQ